MGKQQCVYTQHQHPRSHMTLLMQCMHTHAIHVHNVHLHAYKYKLYTYMQHLTSEKPCSEAEVSQHMGGTMDVGPRKWKD